MCQEKFEIKYLKNKRYREIIGHCHYPGKYRDATNSISNFINKRTAVIV